MNAVRQVPRLSAARAARGFTLVELMVTVAIAVFLLFGLVTIVENVRASYANQQSLAQLQDQQRFAMTVITDVIQNGGYFANPTTSTPNSAFPAASAASNTPAFQVQSGFGGTHVVGSPGGPDTIGVRYLTGPNDNAIQCDGSNSAGAVTLYTNAFSVVPSPSPTPWLPGAAQGQLMCSVNNAVRVAIVSGVQNMVVYFGVKRNFATNDYNVDTYLTADQMATAPTNDWDNISSVTVILTFTNPLYGQPGQPTGTQYQTISFQRTVEAMARAGVHT